MVDMHIHSNNSDGTDTVEELLKKAEILHLKYISITDHDTCKGYEELKKVDVKNLFSGHIVKGIEIKCSYKKRTIEVLGYNIDTKIMQKWLDDFYKDKKRNQLQMKYFNLLYNKCKKMKLILDEKEDIIWNPDRDWASFTIYSEIKRHEENKNRVPKDLWESFAGFNRKYCNDPDHVLYIDKSQDYPSLEETILAIKKAKGLVFMPHLYVYKWVENKNEFINEFVEIYKIDGIECYYTDFKEEETNYLLELCEKHNLYISGGSDYHGKNKPKISLAKGYGNLNINEEIIKKWI